MSAARYASSLSFVPAPPAHAGGFMPSLATRALRTVLPRSVMGARSPPLQVLTLAIEFAFRVQHFASAFRVPHSVFRIPCSAFRVPHSAFRVRRSAFSILSYHPKIYANINGATIDASLSTMNFGVVASSFPQVIFSFGTAPEYEPYDVVESDIWQK
jgi:hypothetical protein